MLGERARTRGLAQAAERWGARTRRCSHREISEPGGRAADRDRPARARDSDQGERAAANDADSPAPETSFGPAPRSRSLVVRGCNDATYIAPRHVAPHTDGGPSAPEALARACGPHQAALEEGRISIERRTSTGFVIRHGAPQDAEITLLREVMAEVFVAVRALCSPETGSCRALA